MKTASKISEELAEVRDELQGIVSLATKEDRELSADEQTRVSAITDESIPELTKALESRNKLDAEIKAIAASRLAPRIDKQERQASNDPATQRASE